MVRKKLSTEVQVALIAGVATVVAALIAAVVALATRDSGSSPSSSPSSSSASPVVTSTSTSIASTADPDITPAATTPAFSVDAAGATVDKALTLHETTSIDFDASPWTFVSQVAIPDHGLDFGFIGGYFWGGYDAGVTFVPSDSGVSLDRKTCPDTTGYTQGISNSPKVGEIYCLHTTENKYFLITVVAHARESAAQQYVGVHVYGWN